MPYVVYIGSNCLQNGVFMSTDNSSNASATMPVFSPLYRKSVVHFILIFPQAVSIINLNPCVGI